jgi:predicted DNA-binding transcriptional regulator AlpA
MPLNIEGVDYYLATEVAKSLGVSRQTLWRWRSDKKIPQGNLLRGKRLIFTRGEWDAIREFAHRVEPIVDNSIEQLTLFRAPSR